MYQSAIYIHVPWCRRRCPYCNFYFVVGKPKDNFIDAILAEFNDRNFFKQANSLYFGGGTPSLFSPDKLTHLIDYFLRENFLAPDAEITVEMNPEDLSDDYVSSLQRSLINRISLGVQSFDDEVLQFLGRKHTGKMARTAIEKLKRAGKNNISVDLIVGVHREKFAFVDETLTYLNDNDIPHISAYLLTIEEGTHFFRNIKAGKMKAPFEDDQADIYRLVQKKLVDMGYIQYDISSYAKPNFFSRHNQVYWSAGVYLGLGPGAHSMRLLQNGGVARSHNVSSLAQWLKNPGQSFVYEELSPKDALYEALAFGLRNMATGINPMYLSKRHKTPLPARFFEVIEKYKDRGFINEASTIKITGVGALFADAIMREILLMD